MDLEEGVLLEDATEAGLMGASFLRRRVLSRPFSLGECAGLPRGEDGSYKDKHVKLTTDSQHSSPLLGTLLTKSI